MNKLIGIWNVFDSEELLPYSVNQIKSEVDIRIAVIQTTSNRGEVYEPKFEHSLFDYVLTFEPNKRRTAMQNETDKRNMGIEFAKTLGGTHYILLDCDELYHTKEFARLKTLIYGGARYSACRMYTYYGSPTQRIEPIESYFVPFINELTPHTHVGNNRNYPITCDPTRKDMRLRNAKDILLFSNPIMHHFSWVRKDLARKLRNSTSEVYRTMASETAEKVKRGELVHFKGNLIEVENIFGIEI